MSQEPTAPQEVKNHVTWQHLEDQRAWYSRESGANKRRYLQIKVIQIVLSGSIPVVALMPFNPSKYIVAIFGAVIAILEVIQHLFQFHSNWIEYRSTSEQLKHERYLFLAASGPYRQLGSQAALLLLAERIEEHISKEHAKWINTANQTATKIDEQIKTPII